MRSAADSGTPRALAHVQILRKLMKRSSPSSKVRLCWRYTSGLTPRTSLEFQPCSQHWHHPHGYRCSRDGSGRRWQLLQVLAANAGLQRAWPFLSRWSVTNQAGSLSTQKRAINT